MTDVTTLPPIIGREGGWVGGWREGGREGSREGGEKAREAYITMNSTLQTDRYVVC